MTVEIRDWPLDSIGDLADVYNAQVAGLVPHCSPVTPEVYAREWTSKTDRDNLDFMPDGNVFVGLAAGKVRGFAHVRIGHIMGPGEMLEGGFIHFLTYEVGHRAVGQALLETCERRCQDAGVQTVHAFDGHFYRFHHLGYSQGSDKMGHVCGLLGMNGYEVSGEGEVFMECLDYDIEVPQRPKPAAEIQVKVIEGQGKLPNLTVQAIHLGLDLGNCKMVSCGDYAGAPEAQDHIFVNGLWVMREVRGRGWGRYLLTRGLSEVHALGYRHTAISTAATNYRAQLFYTNLGYRVTDTVYRYVKGRGPHQT